MGAELAEAAAEGDLLVGIQVLSAEEQDLVLVEGRPERGDGPVVERPAQVEAVDLGPEDAGDRLDLERRRRHRHPSRALTRWG